MTLPGTALPFGVDARDVARRVMAAREGFLTTGRVPTDLRRLVVESWRRSLAQPPPGPAPVSGLDVAPRVDFTPRMDLSDADFETYRAGHPLALVLPVVRQLLVADAAEAGMIVALTDAHGRLLWVEGATGSRRRAESIGFCAGALWSEAAAGTNAPGTALALDQPVQIFAGEHLADPVTPWSCSAAPIHAPDGTLLGAIDLTGGDEVAAPHNLTLVRTVAAAIEAELRLHQLRSATPPTRRQTPAPAPAVGGEPVRVRLLGHPHGELTTSRGVTPLRLRHSEILLLLTLSPKGLTADQLAVELHDRTTAPVTLRAEMSRLRDLLARHGVTLHSRPYRLSEGIDSDVAELRALLTRGAYRRALQAFEGAVLPESTAPGVEAVRERLRCELRACLLAAGEADLLWQYAQTVEGSEDLEIWEACEQALPPGSRRRPVVSARVRQLHEDFG